MPTFEEENPSIGIGNEEVISPADVLDVHGIDIDDYLPRLDALFDSLDAQSSSFTSIVDFGTVVDQAMASEALFLEGYLEAKKPEPRKAEVVTVTARRGAGLSLPRGGGGLASLISPQQRINVRQNLKAIFPGITDAEIDAIVAQIENSPSAMLALLRVGDIPTRASNGVTTANLRNSQLRTINGVLRSLNTTQSINALNLLGAAVRSGRVRVIRG